MLRIALVGPEIEENLSLRYLASSLTAAGFQSAIVPFDRPEDLTGVLATLLDSGNVPGSWVCLSRFSGGRRTFSPWRSHCDSAAMPATSRREATSGRSLAATFCATSRKSIRSAGMKPSTPW